MVPYAAAWALQKELQHARIKNAALEDVVLVLEHPPVYTLGRGASEANLKFGLVCPKPGTGSSGSGSTIAGRNADAGVAPDADDYSGNSSLPEVHRIERGGEVTYHGPGQLVVYPVLNLNRHKRDLHWYMRQCEEVTIRSLADYGIEGTRDLRYTGVWVGGGQRKIAAMGFSVSRWVTMHGLALNVDVDLAPFTRIVPCGIDEAGRGVTSVREELRAAARSDVYKSEVRQSLLRHFSDVFGLELDVEEGLSFTPSGGVHS